MGRRKKDDEKAAKPKVNPELEGFDIKINSFGEISSSFDLDKLHTFLDENVEDKKLKHLEKPSKEEEI